MTHSPYDQFPVTETQTPIWKRPGIIAGEALATAAAVTLTVVAADHNSRSSHEKAHSAIGYASAETGPLSDILDMSAISAQLSPDEIEQSHDPGNSLNGYDAVKLIDFSATEMSFPQFEEQPQSDALTPEAKSTIEKIMAHDKTLISYLIWSNKIDKISFAIATNPKQMEGLGDGDVRFTPKTLQPSGAITQGAVTYVLPPSGKVTAQSAAVLLDHEGVHLTQRDLQAVDKSNLFGRELTDEILTTNDKLYAQLLGQIRTASIKAAESDPKVIAAAHKVVMLNKSAHKPDGRAELTVALSILNGTFSRLQPTSNKPSKLAHFKIPEGRTNDTYFAAFELAGTDAPQTLTPTQQAAQHELEVSFDEAIYSPSSMLALFKESTYLEGKANESDGHPGDATSEIFASAMNVMMNFPEQFAQRLKGFPTAEKNTVLTFMQQLTADTIQANAVDPGSITFITNVRDTFTWVSQNAA